MRLTIIAVLISTCFIFLSCNSQNLNEDKEAIRKLMEDNAITFSNEDFEGWSKLWVHSDDFLHVWNDVIPGYIAFEDTIKAFWNRTSNLDSKVSNVSIHVSGDVAWVTLTAHWAWNVKIDGEKPPINLKGIVTYGLVKRNGKWLILHQHATTVD